VNTELQELRTRVAALESEVKGEAGLSRKLFEFLSGDRGRIDGLAFRVGSLETTFTARFNSLETETRGGFSRLEIEALKLRADIGELVAKAVGDALRADLGPVVRSAVAEELGPIVRASVEEALKSVKA
jgi:hypothetical protein